MPVARIANHRIHYHISNGCAVLRPEGPCNESRAAALARLADSSLVDSKDLIVDLSHTRYVETPGFRWLVRRVRELQAAGRSLVVVGLPPSVERTFKLLRLDEIVPTAGTVAEALAMIRSAREPALV